MRWSGVGRNSERDRISTKKRLKNASEPSIQAEIASPPIPNSIFFLWEGRVPGFPAKSRAYGAREKIFAKSGFSCTPFQTLARHVTSLSTDLPAGFKGPLLSSNGMAGRGGRKGKGGERKGWRKQNRVPPSTFEYNLTASTLRCHVPEQLSGTTPE